jgi:uncharacterized protein YjdB
MSRRIMALALVLAMVFSLLPTGAFAETSQFTDMPSNWSTEALQEAVNSGLLTGFNSKIMPNDKLTRAQMATIINRAFGAKNQESLTKFSDVTSTQWYYAEMAKSVAMGTFQGSGENLYPNNPITREEAFAVIARALKLSPSASAPSGYSDLNQISSWASGEVYSLVNSGYIKGSNGLLNPKGHITRAEFAQVMFNIIKEYMNLAGENSIEVTGNVMINVPGVTLKDSVINGDLIIGDGVGEGEVTLDNVKVTGRLLVRGGGQNSIIIKGGSSIGSITIAKVDGVVRIYAEDGTEIGEVIVDGKDDVILEGTFVNITVLADDITVWANDATITSVSIEGDDTKIIIGAGSTVEELVLSGNNIQVEVSGNVKTIQVSEVANEVVITVKNGGEVDEIIVNSPDTIVKGDGEVDIVKANADDVIVLTMGTKVTAAMGTSGVMAGDVEVEEGDTEEVKVEAAPSAGGGGGGGGGSSEPPVIVTPAVTSVTVTPATATVVQGGTKQLTATVSVVGGAAQTVTWTSNNAKVAVSAEGLVTVAADATPDDYVITATSTVDTTKSAMTLVTVNEVIVDNINASDGSIHVDLSGSPNVVLSADFIVKTTINNITETVDNNDIQINFYNKTYSKVGLIVPSINAGKVIYSVAYKNTPPKTTRMLSLEDVDLKHNEDGTVTIRGNANNPDQIEIRYNEIFNLEPVQIITRENLTQHNEDPDYYSFEIVIEDLPEEAYLVNVIARLFTSHGGSLGTGTSRLLDEEEPAPVPMTVNATVPEFTVGVPATFTVGTIANSDAGKMVKAHFTIPAGVTVEYQEGGVGAWLPLVDVFGPASGFPLGNITSTFRGTFTETGTKTVKVDFIEVGTNIILGSTDITATVVAVVTFHL